MARGQGPADAPWAEPIREQIPDLAYAAGVNDYELPAAPGAPALAGPGAADVEAASELSDEDRQQMIEGMVDRLGARLAEQGGSPQEWGQLLGALGVLGRTEQAAAIWQEAQAIFAAQPDALAIVRAGAARAGVVE